MTSRKRKLLTIQFILLFIGVLIIYLTYYKKDSNIDDNLISEELKKNVIEKTADKDSNDGDVFFNIEYSGLDLNGNRYLLKSEEAFLDEASPEIVNMKTVNAIFYFKDNTVLYVWAEQGIYNNKSLDMKFRINVKAKYLESDLFADKADYSNTNNYLSIYENVRINDKSGNLIADKLLFDITEQKLDITSFNNGKINANVKLNEKRF